MYAETHSSNKHKQLDQSSVIRLQLQSDLKQFVGLMQPVLVLELFFMDPFAVHHILAIVLTVVNLSLEPFRIVSSHSAS